MPTIARPALLLLPLLAAVQSMPAAARSGTDPAPLEAGCRDALLAEGVDPDAEDVHAFDADVPIEALEAVGSACGDFLFWTLVPRHLQRGDAAGALRAWTLAISRAALRRTVEPEPDDPSAYALYGALNAAFGPALSDVAQHDPALVAEATADAIAFDLAHPSVEFPPERHPEAYAEVRELLARRLASAREGLPDAR